MKSESSSQIVLPPSIKLDERLGHGARSDVYAGLFEGRSVAVKVYRDEAIEKYRRRYGLSIAKFEHDRNLAFVSVPGLHNYGARPYCYFERSSGYSELFVQERVEGRRLREMAKELGYVPATTLESLRAILELTSSAGLYDIDFCSKNIIVRQVGGDWQPILFDFNLIPQYMHAPNPWVALLYWTGIRKRSFRDYRHLRNLENWQAARARGAV